MSELKPNQGRTHFLDHDYRGRWYLIPNGFFCDWLRWVNKGRLMDLDPQAFTFAKFRVKPTAEMREIYRSEP